MHTHTCIRLHMHARTHTYTNAYTHVHLHAHTYIHTHTYTGQQPLNEGGLLPLCDPSSGKALGTDKLCASSKYVCVCIAGKKSLLYGDQSLCNNIVILVLEKREAQANCVHPPNAFVLVCLCICVCMCVYYSQSIVCPVSRPARSLIAV
jgi:hypothetical protein